MTRRRPVVGDARRVLLWLESVLEANGLDPTTMRLGKAYRLAKVLGATGRGISFEDFYGPVPQADSVEPPQRPLGKHLLPERMNVGGKRVKVRAKAESAEQFKALAEW